MYTRVYRIGLCIYLAECFCRAGRNRGISFRNGPIQCWQQPDYL